MDQRQKEKEKEKENKKNCPLILLAEEASRVSSITNSGSENSTTSHVNEENSRNSGRKKGSTTEGKRKHKERYNQCIDSITRKYTEARQQLKEGEDLIAEKKYLTKNYLEKLI